MAHSRSSSAGSDGRGVLQQPADRSPVLGAGVGAYGGRGLAGLLQQLALREYRARAADAAQLVDQHRLEVGLQHLVVAVGDARRRCWW